MDSINNWHFKKKEDMTIEDALQAELEGFSMVCEDGKVIIIADSMLV